MKCTKRLSRALNRCGKEFKKIKLKLALLFGLLFFLLGVFTWSFGGETHRILTLYDFPRMAMPVVFMYVFWSIVYIIMGTAVFGIVSCSESYNKAFCQKISFYLTMSLLFTNVAYLLFFSAIAPFMAFVIYLISAMFCFFALIISKRFYILWTIILALYFAWLVYSMLIPLGFLIIN